MAGECWAELRGRPSSFFVDSYSPLGLPKLFIGGKVSAADLPRGAHGLDEGAAVFFQAAHIGVAVIGFSVSPAHEINAHEFEGQGPDGGVVFFAFPLVLIVSARPGLAVQERCQSAHAGGFRCRRGMEEERAAAFVYQLPRGRMRRRAARGR